jgi:hypothetical protein
LSNPFIAPRWPASGQWEKVFLGAALVAVWGLSTPNPMLMLLAMAVLAALGPMLWRAGATPVLAWLALLQWMEAGIPVLMASVAGEPLGAASNLAERETAAALALTGVLVLAAGMRLGLARQRAWQPNHQQDLQGATTALSVRALATWYGAGLAIGLFSSGFLWLIPGTRQLLLPLIDIRWIVIVLIIWAAVWHPPARRLAAMAAIVEIIIGFGGYFSGFKQVLLVALLTLLWAACYTQRRSLSAWYVVIVAVALALLSFWQVVKGDYRQYVNQGTSSQVVLVSPLERGSFLLEAASGVGIDDLAEGLVSGLERISYIEYFALSIAHVPRVIPYQEGRLWGEAIDHVLRPRLFFPDKAAIDDSVRVREFTGQNVAGAESGTSINIGYFGESYIDFGPIGMFVPIFLVGLAYGLVYSLLVRLAPNPLLGVAVATTTLLATYGGSNIKLLGGTLTTLIVYSALLRFGGRALWNSMAARHHLAPRFVRS